MIRDYGLNQKQTAEKLGITPAAISQYLSGKRGNVEIKDEEILKEIKLSAKRIIEAEESVVIEETCRMCLIMRKRSIFSVSCNLCIEKE